MKLKLKEKPAETYHETVFARIRINAISDAGEIFDTGMYGFEAKYKEFDKVKELLAKGKAGDTKSVSFTWQYLGQDEDMGSRIFNEATTFELIDDGFEAGEKPESTKSVDAIEENTEEGEDYDAISEEHLLNQMANESTKTSTSNNAEIDKWIDEYEEYFKTMAKFYKKAKNGDQSAYVEYAKALQKFQQLQSKLHGLENELTPTQIARVSHILQQFSMEIQ